MYNAYVEALQGILSYWRNDGALEKGPTGTVGIGVHYDDSAHAGCRPFTVCGMYPVQGRCPYVFWRISADKQHGQHGRFDCCKIVLPGGRILYFRMGERAGFQKRCFYCNKGMQPCKAMACITKFPFSKNPRYDTILQEMKTQRKAEPER